MWGFGLWNPVIADSDACSLWNTCFCFFNQFLDILIFMDWQGEFQKQPWKPQAALFKIRMSWYGGITETPPEIGFDSWISSNVWNVFWYILIYSMPLFATCLICWKSKRCYSSRLLSIQKFPKKNTVLATMEVQINPPEFRLPRWQQSNLRG